MWRCPGCMAHVEDAQGTCPTCHHRRPEQLTNRAKDQGAALPRREGLSEPHPLLPRLPARDVWKSEWSPSLVKAHLIAFAAGYVATWLVRTAGTWQIPASAKEALGDVTASFLANLFPGGVMGVFAVLGWALARMFLPGEGPSPDEFDEGDFGEEDDFDEDDFDDRLDDPDEPQEPPGEAASAHADLPDEAIRPANSDLTPGDRP